MGALARAEKAAWLVWLRSGKHKQGRYQLGNEETGYCCLGGFCLANGIDFNPSNTGLASGPSGLLNTIPFDIREELTALNDVRRMTFAEIADVIEADERL